MEENTNGRRRMTTGWRVFHVIAVLLIAAIITTLGVMAWHYYKQSRGMQQRMETRQERVCGAYKDGLDCIQNDLCRIDA